MQFTVTKRTTMQQVETSRCQRYSIESNWLLDGTCKRVAWFMRDMPEQQRIAEGTTPELMQACIAHSKQISSTTPTKGLSHVRNH